MEECESLDSEMTELQGFQCEAADAVSQDDEDEVEELRNSLREVVQDPSVKPKLQCLMVDPAFSMVTVQSEDSGIVWETASSRCSTPWASETSSLSEACSMEGSGGAGKITIIFDEEKVIRRRSRSGGRLSRLGDRLSRPGSSRSASALGVERPEMAEVSLPNVKQEKAEAGPDLEEIKNKDQQLFSLISEGYEILNIRVPSKLPTVDEEESTELQDNLSYLDQTPKIRSRNDQTWTQPKDPILPDEMEISDEQEPLKQDSSQSTVDTEIKSPLAPKESTGDFDYFEKFTLLDHVVPGEQVQEHLEEVVQPAKKPQAEEQKPATEATTGGSLASEDSFVIVTDVEILGEHLDEVFYGQGAPMQQREDDELEVGEKSRVRRESQRSMKENGSVLFGSEETILTPIFISPGPPKIIDPILLEEPTAMSFMYSDLYEDAMGERRKSIEENCEAESVGSEKSFKRCESDSEEADGYLEKFTLKDETHRLEVQSASMEDIRDRRDRKDRRKGMMMWSQNEFDTTGCLMRVVEVEEEDKVKQEEPKVQEDSSEEKRVEPQTEKEKKVIQATVSTEEQAIRHASEKSIQECKPVEEKMQGQEARNNVKRDQAKPPERRTDKLLPVTQRVEKENEKTEKSEQPKREEPAKKSSERRIIESEQPQQTQKETRKTWKAPVSTDVPQTINKSKSQPKTAEKKSLPEEAATESKSVESPAQVKEPETRRRKLLNSSERSIETETSLSGEKAAVAPEKAAPVDVFTDCEAAVQALVKVSEPKEDENEIQTKVQIDLQEVTSAGATLPKAEKAQEASTEEIVVQLPPFVPEAYLESEVKNEVTAAQMPEEGLTDLGEKQLESLETGQHQHDKSAAGSAMVKTKFTAEPGAQTPMVQDLVDTGDELILRVPKGKTVEMDIEISEWSEGIAKGEPDVKLTASEREPEVALKLESKPPAVENITKHDVSEPEKTCEMLISSENTKICSEALQAAIEEPQLEEEPEVNSKLESPLRNELDESYSPAVEEAHAPEPEKTCEQLRTSENDKTCSEATVEEPLLEKEPEVALKLESLLEKEVDRSHPPPTPVEEGSTEENIPKSDVSEPDKTCKQLISAENAKICSEVLHGAIEEPHLEKEPEVHLKLKSLLENEVEGSHPPATPVEEAATNEKITKNSESDPDKTCEFLTSTENAKICSEVLQTAIEEPYLEKEPQVALKPESLLENELDRSHPSATPVKEASTEEKITTSDVSEPDDTSKILIRSENAKVCSEILQAAMEEPHLEDEPEVDFKLESLLRHDQDRSPVQMEDAGAEDEETEGDLNEDMETFSPLRSFTAQEDLSELLGEYIEPEPAELEQEEEMHTVEEAPETKITPGHRSLEMDLHREDIRLKPERDEVVSEGPDTTVEEPGYEMVSKQDARDITGPETLRDIDSGLEREDTMEMKVEQEVLDLPADEDLDEEDYDIIDAEEEQQARLAAELQGMDWFCLTCECLLSRDERESADHRDHQVTEVDDAYEGVKEKLSDWISALQGRSENIEDLVSELELGYNSVEDQFVETEVVMRVQNEDMMALVMEQYNNMSVSMEEEKKAKLEHLYDRIVSFQENIDSAKATLETTAREAETEARTPEDIHERLKAALDSAMSLEVGPKGLLVLEDYAKGNAAGSNLAQRKGIPVPQRPTLQPQEQGSATSTNVTVYWKVNPGDIIDCFQVYCMEDPQGAVSEEYRVTVKESYCVLEELEPDRTYKVWVMAVNYTGCSLPSDRLAFTTAPSVPVIDTQRCTVLWDSAVLRWSSGKQAGQSYMLEYCRQYELEGEGLRSISGIRSCEHSVLLQPNENYLFYIKAVNQAGSSEQSEAALISTKGTRFQLLEASAHPGLQLSADHSVLHYSHDASRHAAKLCPSILGELLPARGHYYWETIVSGSAAYRLGVAYGVADHSGPLGENDASWCLQCIPAPSGCRYQLLHNSVQSSVFVVASPEQVGTLLDFRAGRLSFYNARTGQLLGAFGHAFARPCHAALALDMPGHLEVSMAPEVPAFARDS